MSRNEWVQAGVGQVGLERDRQERDRRTLERFRLRLLGEVIVDPGLSGAGRFFASAPDLGLPGVIARLVAAGAVGVTVGAGLAGVSPAAAWLLGVLAGGVAGVWRVPLLRDRRVQVTGFAREAQTRFAVARRRGLVAVDDAARTGGVGAGLVVAGRVEAELWALACALRTSPMRTSQVHSSAVPVPQVVALPVPVSESGRVRVGVGARV